VPIAKILGKRTIGKISLMGTDDPVSLSEGILGRFRLLIMRRLDIWISLTAEAIDTCLNVGIPEERIVQITNGVKCKKFSPIDDKSRSQILKEYNIEGRFVVLFAGIISYRKGVDLIIEALPTLFKKNANLTFVFVGPCSRKENPQVDEELVEKLRSLSSNIIVTGFIDNPIDLIRSANVFVLPSRKEGLSNALLEAMSSGLPIVVTNHSWLEDVGIDGEHFLSFPEGSSDDLTERITRLIENPALRKDLSARTREKIKQDFCLPVIAKRYHELYDNITTGIS
ncbi:MAG: glycosyltransferase family 4 protein, partial [Candidatus Thorarchaeota archaeon]|nr:glycosyltransferase family 4 protein [Candidatus Thorarchaeota archaeon]